MAKIDLALPWARYQRLPSQAWHTPLQAYKSCPLSGSQNEKTLMEMQGFQLYSDTDGMNRILQRTVWNNDSGLIYNNPTFTPEGFDFLFEKAGYSYGFGNTFREEWLKNRREWVIKRSPNAKRVLDIGCGRGDLLFNFPDHWESIGIDVDAGSIESAKAYFQNHAPERKVQFHHAAFDRFIPAETPDIITMFHVLEHLPEPLETLRHIRTIADEHTRFVVEVPVIEMAARGLRVDICGYFSVMHLFHYSQATLYAMMAQAGWEIIETEQINLPLYNGYRVLAKPSKEIDFVPNQDALEKDRRLVNQCLSIWENVKKNINNKLDALPAGKPVVIYGAGLHSEYLTHHTGLFQQDRQFLFVDNDAQKTGTTLHNIPIYKPSDVLSTDFEKQDFYIVPSSYLGQAGIVQSLVEQGFPRNRIVELYQID